MNQVELFKALSNPIRLQILTWLKDPFAHFPPQGLHIPEGDSFENAVCVGSIQEKLGISQSTVSHYLDLMQRSAFWSLPVLESGPITEEMKRISKP